MENKKQVETQNTEDRTEWHVLSVDEVAARLESPVAEGLTTAEAEKRQAEHGANTIEQAKRISWFRLFARQFNNVLIYVLLVAAVFTAMLEHYIDTAVILAVVVINAIIGVVQEGKAEKAIDSIRNMLAPIAVVLRDGRKKSLQADLLVPGDVVFLEAGDKVPADIRLVKAHNLSVQESVLTGESIAVDKLITTVDKDAPIGDRANLVFSGTMITRGQGKGIVVATGMNAEIGKISHMLSEVETLTTPLLQQMSIFARWLTLAILCVAGVLMVFGYFVHGQNFNDLFMAVVGLSVSAIPEGLPAVLTITFATGVQAMARRNAIVRRLPIIETLGSVSVICTDKTGTLTKNEMTVRALVTLSRSYEVEGSGYAPEGQILSEDRPVKMEDDAGLLKLITAGMLCNDATLDEKDGLWSVRGDPMEGALLALGRKAGLVETEEESRCPRCDIIPFDTEHKFMATLHSDTGGKLVFIKGAPEKMISLCPFQYNAAGEKQEIDPDYWHQKAEEIASEGQRVLALAFLPVAADKETLSIGDIEGQAIFLGLVGLMDPPRPEAIEAISDCRSAGISVKMITGDHAKTAVAIGRMVGLEHPETVLTGAEIDAMDDAALAKAVLTTDVFARTSPAHKLRLVTALQAHNLVVAMTGDGANDAPALKRADAGIAMGQKGSDAARESSELILIDDNFASIASAIWVGRTVYDNLKKVISWTLPTNVGEAGTIVVALLLGMVLPITPIQILWVNLITAVTLGLALAFEPMEPGTKQRPPRPRDAPLLDGDLVWHIVLVSSLILGGVFGMFRYAEMQGYEIELSRTIALNTLITLKIFHLLYIRNIRNVSLSLKAVSGTRIVWLTIAIVFSAQMMMTYVPSIQQIFETRAVSFSDSMLMLGLGLLFFAVIEAEKQIRVRLTD